MIPGQGAFACLGFRHRHTMFVDKFRQCGAGIRIVNPAAGYNQRCIRLAKQSGDVCVMVGDGSYLMMNSEIATSVMLDQKLILIVLDNRGFGCIDRLQQACGGAPFNNLLDDSQHAHTTLSYVRQVDCRANCTNCGGR